MDIHLNRERIGTKQTRFASPFPSPTSAILDLDLLDLGRIDQLFVLEHNPIVNLCLFLFHELLLPHPFPCLLWLHGRLSGHRHLYPDSMAGSVVDP